MNTFTSSNWGGQATSNGIKHLIYHAYPGAKFIPIDLPDLPFKKVKILRKYYENKLVKAILLDDLQNVLFYLKKMNISESLFDQFSHICFNGEGTVHYKSGHIRLFMGLLYMAKKQGKHVAAVNQTIDLNHDKILDKLLNKVYNDLDFVSVREPLSYEYAKAINIQKVQLIPDAVYGLPKMNKNKIFSIVKKYYLPEKYITVTGSSALKRNKSSLIKMKKIIQYCHDYFNLPIVFMANAKTDIWLAHKLKNQFDLMIIEPPVKYQDAMAIIASSEMLVGGRQHPNIFAYIYEVPYLPYEGNTFKNKGVAMLQHYPIHPLHYNSSKEEVTLMLNKLMSIEIHFNKIIIDNFKIFG